MSELLTKFGGLLDEYAQHREYIAKAQGQAEKFSNAVIEKVVLDHEVKASGVADGILPLVPEIEARIAEIDCDVAGDNNDKAGADEQYQELELRNAIGELAEGEFETLSADLKAKLDSSDARLAELAETRAAHADALARWVDLAAQARQDDGTSAGRDDEAAVGPEDGAPDEAAHAPDGVFGDEASVAEVEVDDDEDIAIEAGDADVDFGFEDDDSDSSEEVELNLVDGDDVGEAGSDEIGIDLEVGAEEADEGDSDEAADGADDAPAAEDAEDARRALLLYQEGTADEQIYPFTGEVLTVGRGRDNDIQIKNDSKVSRFHCKLFRRSGNFYIEDNKSSNGTLVNGELITERRLFGGEEVIIGETFFRFRIM
ncbi:MAG: FHA domain-containing protein [Myxococcota bacterium]|nr:FHA domain-containing protein [Myxococcota bacterium]